MFWLLTVLPILTQGFTIEFEGAQPNEFFTTSVETFDLIESNDRDSVGTIEFDFPVTQSTSDSSIDNFLPQWAMQILSDFVTEPEPEQVHPCGAEIGVTGCCGATNVQACLRAGTSDPFYARLYSPACLQMLQGKDASEQQPDASEVHIITISSFNMDGAQQMPPDMAILMAPAPAPAPPPPPVYGGSWLQVQVPDLMELLMPLVSGFLVMFFVTFGCMKMMAANSNPSPEYDEKNMQRLL